MKKIQFSKIKKSSIINPLVAHSGKTAEAIFNKIKNKHGEVTHNEILSYMKKQGSSLKFNVKDPDKKYNIRELNSLVNKYPGFFKKTF